MLQDVLLNIDSVAVLGAGPCGLATAKYLLAEKKFSRVRVFEQRDTIGGVWTHTPINVIDEDFTIPRTTPSQLPDTAVRVEGCSAPKFVSAVYDYLETNIPHTLMNYSDKTFPEGSPLFPPHAMVKKYLEEYGNELKDNISLSTQVISVTKVEENGRRRWDVASLDLKTAQISTEQFDAVMVASGHYNDPYIPDIPGIAEFSETYPGSISHSKFYRNPSDYKGKKVIIVGNSASGIDLSAQISVVCEGLIIISEKSVPNTPVEERSWAKMVPEIIKFDVEGKSATFANGDVEAGIDAVVFCTGYFYSYPFLKNLPQPITTDGSCAHRLYEHILYIDDPTLAFVGIPQRVVPFPISEAQSAWVARIWAGRLPVPSRSHMSDWETETLTEKGPGKTLHNLAFPRDVEYINRLHCWSMSAQKNQGLENDGLGKQPPYWNAEAAWVRQRFPLIKIAYRKLGDKRGDIKTLAELGFDYAEWKAAQKEEGDEP